MNAKWVPLEYAIIGIAFIQIASPFSQYVNGQYMSSSELMKEPLSPSAPLILIGEPEGEASDFSDEGEASDFSDGGDGGEADASDFSDEGEASDFATRPEEPSEPQDFGSTSESGEDGQRFPLNAGRIAEELISLSPLEIRQFPITDLSAEDLGLVFSYLNPSNLAKVLLNIPVEDLSIVKDMLPPATFEETINRLPVENRTLVENRLSTPSSLQ
jgi:hypothetical protein